MKIAFVVHDYHRSGGHARYVAELATRFSREHEVHVFANRIERGSEDGIAFHTVPAWHSNVVTTMLSFAVTSRAMVRGGFDVVHSQGFCGPRSNVVTTHICNAAWSRALSAFAGQTARERIFHFLASKLEKNLYGGLRQGRVIAISRRVARDVVEDYNCKAPIDLIYHGVDLQTFSPSVRRFRAERRQALGLREDALAFLYVGDLRKGAAQSIRALQQVAGAHLVLVSPTAPKPYQALAQECGVAERVHLVSASKQVEQFYGAADALLLPTPYDAFAMVVTEAMACGLPVIVSREAGASELIEHGVNGLILERPADCAELARHMRTLQGDASASARIGQVARATAERFSWDAVAQQTMQVYRQVVEDRSSAIELCQPISK